MKRILVCGDRNWTDAATIARVLAPFQGGQVVVIHGDCRGADRLAARIADSMGIPTEAFPADWKRHGKAAGPIRNREMLDTKPDIGFAFHDNLDKSKGTRDCVTEARARGVQIAVVESRQRAAAASAGSAPGGATDDREA